MDAYTQSTILTFISLNILCCCSQSINTNSSLITRQEFRELVDLISEEKQLRHTLEHNVDTLRQQIAASEADYQSLQSRYQNLSRAYNNEKAINSDLVRQFGDFTSINRSIKTTLSINHADILDLKQKQGHASAFTAWYPTASYSVTEPLIFATVLYNIGGDYDSTSGKFTCRFPGLYMFTLNLYKPSSTSYSYAKCYITKNGSATVYANNDPYSSADNGYYEATNSVVMHLARGDVVTVGSCSGYVYSYSSFTGFLVKSD